MPGNNQQTVVLQPRDRVVLTLLSSSQLASQDQLRRYGAFRSRTRVSDRLSKLVAAGYLSRQYVGTIAGGRQCMYALAGVKLPSARGPAGRDAAIAHRLCLTELRIVLSSARVADEWRQPVALLDGALKPDAFVRGIAGECYIEMDRATESLAVWRSKVERYLQAALQRDVCPAREPRFSILVVADGKGRLAAVRRCVGRLTAKLFWFTTYSQLISAGPFEPIWLRPTNAEGTALRKEENEILPQLQPSVRR